MSKQSLLVRMRRAGVFRWIPDPLSLKIRYYRLFKKTLDLKNPQTFNEKLQWLKLYNRNPLYSDLVDKYKVKEYVADKIGEEYVIKTYSAWNHFDEIPFDDLPDKFVLKCNHDCGSTLIIEDKNSLDREKLRRHFTYFMKNNYYWVAREWPYKNREPKIIAEECIFDYRCDVISDYKLYCFDGEPKLMMISKKDESKCSNEGVHFFDMEGELLPILEESINCNNLPKIPVNLVKMKKLAEKLSKGFPFIRVDFYEACGKIYFGELTFFHRQGIGRQCYPNGING